MAAAGGKVAVGDSRAKATSRRGSHASVRADGPPLLCLDCGRRHAEPLGSYRAAAEPPPRVCRSCGEGPLVDVREPGVLEAMLVREGKRQAAHRQRVAAWATGASAALVAPLIWFRPLGVPGLLAGPAACAATTLAMLAVAALVARLLRPRVSTRTR